jgi:hypothetical protein
MLHGGGVRANSLKRRRLCARAIRTTRRRHWTRRLSRLARHGLVLVAEDQIELVWKARTLAPGLFAVAACRPLLVALRPVSTGPSMAVVWCRRDAARRDRTHQRTLILLLLHMPHPRLGLPVYTMLGVGRGGERMGGGTQQSQKYSLWALFSPGRGDDPRQDRSERVYQENAGSPPPQHTTIIRPARRTLRSLSSSARARHRPRFQDKRDEGHSSHALRNRIVWYAGSERNGVRTPERVPTTWMRAQWQGR